jgi:ABC-type bacteriocin/lantibiotic exporter with double-glycine peptidase domain
MPDYAKAMSAVVNLLELFEKKTKIDNFESNGGKTLRDDEFDGNIKFNGVHFSYPTRKEAKILNGLDLSVYKGKRIALVGSSGCGKLILK